MKKLLLLIFSIILILSCSKNPTEPDKKYLNGNTSPENSYDPTSKGTWWKYNFNSDTSGTFMLFTVGDEILIDDEYYAERNTQIDSWNKKQYIRFNGNDIYLLQQIDDTVMKKESEFLLLKTNAQIGEIWTTVTNLPEGEIFKYDCKIINRDFSMTVRKKIFQNVIEIKMTVFNKQNGILEPVVENYYYYAKGIGLIRSESAAFGSYDLVDYEIKK